MQRRVIFLIVLWLLLIFQHQANAIKAAVLPDFNGWSEL
jgi:hypothetical protein